MDGQRELLAALGLGLTTAVDREIIRRMVDEEIPASDLVFGDAAAVSSLIGANNNLGIFRDDMDDGVRAAREELEFCRAHSIKVLTPWDPAYPRRLLETSDFPRQLFMLGDCDLNNLHPLAIVGTRRATNYGLRLTEQTVAEMKDLPGLSIVSGLALGIDGAAHSAALQWGVPTVGVLAHGLSRIYPAQHRILARSIIRSGGALLTEYTHAAQPYRGHFLERNRIIAGMSDVVLIVESAVKGGAMSTASQAFAADRTVVAFPGRVNDEQSGGCNALIRQNKAMMVTSASDIIFQLAGEVMPIESAQLPGLFPELEGESRRIYEQLRRAKTPQSLDQLSADLALPVPRLLNLISDLEFDGIVSRLPGNRIELN